MSTDLAVITPAAPTALDPTELRRQRGAAIAEVTRIEQKQPTLWAVPSQSGSGKYWVRMQPKAAPTCTCPDFEKRNQACKHVFAVQYLIERENHPDGTETITESVTITKKTCAPRATYRQNWPAYNLAQTREKSHFQAILHDLCRGLPVTPRKPGAGRNPVQLSDLTFAAAFKVYSTLSGRRFQTDLDEAHGRGYLTRPVRYNTVFDHFDDERLTTALHSLITESSLPLRSIEVDFAVDSSGFATSRFVRWFDHKYGVVKQEYDWIKVSLMCGVKTNIVTAVAIDEKKGADCPQFAPLVTETAKNFQPREVSADAVYLSYENMDLVGSLGATPYIAFKRSTTAERGGLFAKMFHLYNLNCDEYLKRYHKRSNIESTFSMIKAKFGDHLRSKTDTAMVNEALAKVLCHNLCCLIQSHYELGIEATFWGEDRNAPAESAPACAESDMVDALAWM
jgi:transposase